MTISGSTNAFVRAALATSDEESSCLTRLRDEIEAVPVDERSRQDGNRLAYLKWSLDRVAAGRAILGERQFARARAEENLRETLATFYEACSSIDGDK